MLLPLLRALILLHCIVSEDDVEVPPPPPPQITLPPLPLSLLPPLVPLPDVLILLHVMLVATKFPRFIVFPVGKLTFPLNVASPWTIKSP